MGSHTLFLALDQILTSSHHYASFMDETGESPSLVLANWWNLSTNLCHECHVTKVGTYQVMEHGDEVHGDGDGHVLKMIKLQLKKKKEKSKNKVDQDKCIN